MTAHNHTSPHSDAGIHQEGEHSHPHPHSHGQATHVHSVRADKGLRSLAPGGGLQCIYIDCFSGVSGDMLLGALVDAGLPLDALEAELAKLDLDGYEIEAARVQSHGLTGTRLSVRDTLEAYPARHLHDIQKMVGDSALSDTVKANGLAVIERLGRAEAGIHGVSLQEVHFHEIGAVDTIVDVVGFVVGLELLGVQHVYASAVPLGNGTIQTAHGRLPVPAPATLALLASVGAPTVPHPAQTEIVTPTGAALLSELAVFERPGMEIRAVGYGFGQKEFPWANGLRVWLGDLSLGPRREAGKGKPEADLFSTRQVGKEGFEHDEVVVIECNLDDSTGETLGYTMEQLFAAGALDVWFTPIQMKKNRPGVLLSTLSSVDRVEALSSVLLHETSTLGVRLCPPVHRFKADRRLREVTTPWGRVRVKEKWLSGHGTSGDQRSLGHGVSDHEGAVRLAVSPEYDDCARLARETGEPLVRIMNAARQIAEQDGHN